MAATNSIVSSEETNIVVSFRLMVLPIISWLLLLAPTQSALAQDYIRMKDGTILKVKIHKVYPDNVLITEEGQSKLIDINLITDYVMDNPGRFRKKQNLRIVTLQGKTIEGNLLFADSNHVMILLGSRQYNPETSRYESISVVEIDSLQLLRKWKFWTGAIIGGIVGLGLGTAVLIDYVPDEPIHYFLPLIPAVVGFGIGGAIGFLTSCGKIKRSQAGSGDPIKISRKIKKNAMLKTPPFEPIK